MAAKAAGKFGKAAKKGAAAKAIVPFIKLTIPAAQAKPAPPLGPHLGQLGINIQHFCKDFNAKTAHIKDGYPLPTSITINMDKTFSIQTQSPTTSFLLKKAAGIAKGAMNPGRECAGMVTLKHVYEIAQVKSCDKHFDGVPLKQICNLIIGQCLSLGIKVVRSLGEEEYSEFLAKRAVEVEEQNKLLEEKKAAKMLRL